MWKPAALLAVNLLSPITLLANQLPWVSSGEYQAEFCSKMQTRYQEAKQDYEYHRNQNHHLVQLRQDVQILKDEIQYLNTEERKIIEKEILELERDGQLRNVNLRELETRISALENRNEARTNQYNLALKNFNEADQKYQDALKKQNPKPGNPHQQKIIDLQAEIAQMEKNEGLWRGILNNPQSSVGQKIKARQQIEILENKRRELNELLAKKTPSLPVPNLGPLKRDRELKEIAMNAAYQELQQTQKELSDANALFQKIGRLRLKKGELDTLEGNIFSKREHLADLEREIARLEFDDSHVPHTIRERFTRQSAFRELCLSFDARLANEIMTTAWRDNFSIYFQRFNNLIRTEQELCQDARNFLKQYLGTYSQGFNEGMKDFIKFHGCNPQDSWKKRKEVPEKCRPRHDGDFSKILE